MIKLGSHVAFAKKSEYLIGACQTSLNNGANCMMIYLGAPQNTKRVDIQQYGRDEYFKKYKNLIKAEDIVVHAPYIVNPANPNKQKFAIEFLVQEIKRMNYIGAKYLVLHPGSYTTFKPQEALDCLIHVLKVVIARTENVIICIETMAGKGSEIGINLEQLSYLIKSLNSTRVKMCLDTCHIWDAGYDLKNYETFKKELINFDLLKEIKVIHLNDSKNELASHKDRHANIDLGHIGLKTLAKFVHDKDFDNVPIILETPIPESGSIYKEEITMLLNYKEKGEL
ncbi:deoxyribonuclease IV [Mycoplasma sp. 744]|uniref:deoxyribonuclease IV n=1 Tax=unclassified Mycoplasma TaxID=2683645 RepID=UPI00211CDB64|nr:MULTISPECIES: deoxyribonuclease IV [unclassified Mycoplasma]MEA4115380.1 deoxyribonuclease IV [Mycoplasma sp. 744]UUM19384.1 deoxyribonuclease IV [Mycoplasma sp. 1018B]